MSYILVNIMLEEGRKRKRGKKKGKERFYIYIYIYIGGVIFLHCYPQVLFLLKRRV